MKKFSTVRTLGAILVVVLICVLGGGQTLAATDSGGPGGDVLTGTPERDRLNGGRGDDVVSGLGARDRLQGGYGEDSLSGGAGGDDLLGSGVAGTGVNAHDNGDRGADVLRGDAGPDVLLGGAGPDVVLGGPGDDSLFDDAAEQQPADRARDTLSGGAGDDLIFSTDIARAEDRISCGPGYDRAFVDRGDRVAGDCERARRN